MIYITAITPGTARRHEHIEGIRWLNCDDSMSDTMTMAEAVGWVRQGRGRFWVASDTGQVGVRVVDANPPYLRTVADKKDTDNLLDLPSY